MAQDPDQSKLADSPRNPQHWSAPQRGAREPDFDADTIVAVDGKMAIDQARGERRPWASITAVAPSYQRLCFFKGSDLAVHKRTMVIGVENRALERPAEEHSNVADYEASPRVCFVRILCHSGFSL